VEGAIGTTGHDHRRLETFRYIVVSPLHRAFFPLFGDRTFSNARATAMFRSRRAAMEPFSCLTCCASIGTGARSRGQSLLSTTEDRAMDGIIYLVGLIVVVMAVLSVLGLR
jgi:hypothetical protein